MTDRTHPDSDRIITSGDILLHDAETALMYEELRAAIDGGNESMTHADALAEIAAIRAENEELRTQLEAAPLMGAAGDAEFMRQVVAVAVTMLYDSHKEDVLRVFRLPELNEIVRISEPLWPQQVEDIYKRAWDALSTPSSATGAAGDAEWVPVTERLPEPGIPVLLDIGKKFPIRAVWVAKFTTVATDNDTEWGEYDKDTDEYYDPEGWYEWNQTDETHRAVPSVPIHWVPLPAPPLASEAKGAT